MDEQIKQKALSVIAHHPLYIEAKSKPYCFEEIYENKKSFISGTNFSDAVKKRVIESLYDSETLLFVYLMTSNVRPEPLAGSGFGYGFVIHPKTFEVLHVARDTWRS